MKLIFHKILCVTAFLSISLSQTGCTKEKAEAVKAAAQNFQVEADKALQRTSLLVKASITTTPQAKEAELRTLVIEIEQKERNPQKLRLTLDGVMDRYKTTRSAGRTIDGEFGKMMNEYAIFADMFENLPRGHLFSKHSVAAAERHGVRLTLRFVKMAEDIDIRPVKFEAQRNQLAVDLVGAKALTDVTQRTQAIQIVAQKALDLRAAERTANEEAILQCLKAAEAGKTATELISNYSRMSVADMVNAVSESLGALNQITGGDNVQIKTLLGKYNSFVDSKIKTDPLWKSVWDTEVNL
ncbi:MAG: hypothetical protein DMF63_04730 [Acidobacteria bacterium]|nr:MAG: hypothetical protein DMF63_04730 [Acidobacteriota bacterium]